MKRRGQNSFEDYSLPQAIIRLRQGVGRLIRSRTDTGHIVLLDSRVATRRYGRRFVESLPPCRVVTRD
jgi:ATP-dependent DNA helicase DinG